jgi:hypothetical protein
MRVSDRIMCEVPVLYFKKWGDRMCALYANTRNTECSGFNKILADHVNAAVEAAPDSALTPISLPISYQAAATCDRMPSRSREHGLVVQTTLCLARILGAENLRERWRSGPSYCGRHRAVNHLQVQRRAWWADTKTSSTKHAQSRNPLRLCSMCSHQRPTTYSGMNTVTTVRGESLLTRLT